MPAPRKAITRGFQPRPVTHPETLRVGDRIRVIIMPSDINGIVRIKEGTIGSMHQMGPSSWSWMTSTDELLFVKHGGHMPAVVLLSPAPELPGTRMF